MSNLIGCDAILVGGGGGGTPTVLDEFHYVASDVVESGGAVSQMNDQSGNDRHATQTDGAFQATLVSSDADYNSEPVISFDDDAYYNLFNAASIYYKGGATVFFVGNGSLTNNLWLFGQNGGDSRCGIWTNLFELQSLYIGSSPRDTISYTSPDEPAVYLLSSDGTTLRAYKDGVVIGSTTLTVDGGVAQTLLARGIAVDLSTGRLAEFRVKNEYNLSDINATGAALAAKYGFTWTTIV